MELNECTPYQWSLEGSLRILNLLPGAEKWYFTERVKKEDFLSWLSNMEVKPNSTPRKTDLYLNYRMYGLVPYNISPIQAAIQFGHGVVKYGRFCDDMGKVIKDIYNKWADNDEVFIILNGGTTNNEKGKWYGTLQKLRDELLETDIAFSEFYEPDLNLALTSVNFLVDERVFDTELYPDYVNMPYPWKDNKGYRPKDSEMDKWEVANLKNRKKWIIKIGGEKNDFLRTFLKPLRLANN